MPLVTESVDADELSGGAHLSQSLRALCAGKSISDSPSWALPGLHFRLSKLLPGLRSADLLSRRVTYGDLRCVQDLHRHSKTGIASTVIGTQKNRARDQGLVLCRFFSSIKLQSKKACYCSGEEATVAAAAGS